jgi:hypothetical protein
MEGKQQGYRARCFTHNIMDNKFSKGQRLEVLLWSIALPGFGQIINKKIGKGLLFIALEFLINSQSHLNHVLMLSFQGDSIRAIQQTNYQWLLFYPCVYMYSMWDAYRDAGADNNSFTFLPFVLAAFVSTLAMMYSSKLTIAGMLPGPVWVTMFGCFAGLALGFLIRKLMLKVTKEHSKKD